jgi:hypothetical protein
LRSAPLPILIIRGIATPSVGTPNAVGTPNGPSHVTVQALHAIKMLATATEAVVGSIENGTNRRKDRVMKYDKNRHIPGQIWILAGILALMLAGAWQADADERPNILFVFTDDHAQHAISAYGSVINQTPHREWMPGPDHLTLFDDYEGLGTAAREQEMEIGRHMHLGYDLKVPPDEDSSQVE